MSLRSHRIPAGGAVVSAPRPGVASQPPVLEVKDLTQRFAVHARTGQAMVHAVDRVSFALSAGETLGIVGETGCGKSTLARTVMQQLRPVAGQVLLRGEDLSAVPERQLRRRRAALAMVFQDPFSSLNPRWPVRRLVDEPLLVQHRGNRVQRRNRVDELLGLVGLDPARFGDRRPRQLSGGQAQRVAIARGLALDPDVLICDEVVSALDVSIQAQVLNLLARLKQELGVACVFIGHDLGVVEHVSDRVAVMYLGQFVELATAEALYQRPAHPYTDALLSAVPLPDPAQAATRDRVVLSGEPPSPRNPPSGCRFRTRCPRAQPRCADEEPRLRVVAPDQQVACHYPLVDGPPSQADTTLGTRLQRYPL